MSVFFGKIQNWAVGKALSYEKPQRGSEAQTGNLPIDMT